MGVWEGRVVRTVQLTNRSKNLISESFVMDCIIKECKQTHHWRSAEARTKLRIARALALSAVKFLSGKEARHLKQREDAIKRSKQLAKNISFAVQYFWRIIEAIVIQRQQSQIKMELKAEKELHEQELLDKADKFARAIANGLKGWERGLDPHMIVTSKTPTFLTSEGKFTPIRPSTETCYASEDHKQGIPATNLSPSSTGHEKHGVLKQQLRKKRDLRDNTGAIYETQQMTKEGEEQSEHGCKNKRDCKSDKDDSDDGTDSGDITTDTTVELSASSDTCSDMDSNMQLSLLKQEATMNLDELKKTFGIADDTPCGPTRAAYSSRKKRERACQNGENDLSPSSSPQAYPRTASGRMWKKNKAAVLPAEQKKNEERLKKKDTHRERRTRGSSEPSTKADVEPSTSPLEIPAIRGLCPFPFLLRATLRTYQHEGLTWLLTLHDNNANGILADEMGLGKTVQAIALMAYLACYRGIWGPHLVITPSSVLLNWESEFHRFLPGFKVLTYYGGRKVRERRRQGWRDTKTLNVCIVSYSLVVADAHIFRRKAWYYMFLDEAQHIKNYQSQKWQSLLHFNSQRRVLLTGTPLQNDLTELWSLMHFLMPDLFQSHSYWKEMFSDPLTQAIEASSVQKEKSLVSRLHGILRPFLLRRLKRDVEAQMPSKYEYVLRCTLSQRQRFLYNEFIQRPTTKQKLHSSDYFGLLNILLQLRKICNHPDLLCPREISIPITSFGSPSFTVPECVHLGLTEPWIASVEQRMSRLDVFHPLVTLATNEINSFGYPQQSNRLDLHPSVWEHPRSYYDRCCVKNDIALDSPENECDPPLERGSSPSCTFPYTSTWPTTHRCQPCEQALLKLLKPVSPTSEHYVNANAAVQSTPHHQFSSDCSLLQSSRCSPPVRTRLDFYQAPPSLLFGFDTTLPSLLSFNSACSPLNPCYHRHDSYLTQSVSTLDQLLHPDYRVETGMKQEITFCPPLDALLSSTNESVQRSGWLSKTFSRSRQNLPSSNVPQQSCIDMTAQSPNDFSLYKQALLDTCRSMNLDLKKPVPAGSAGVTARSSSCNLLTDYKVNAIKWARCLINWCSHLRRSPCVNALFDDLIRVGYIPEGPYLDKPHDASQTTPSTHTRTCPIRYSCWGRDFREWLIDEIWKTSPRCPSASVHQLRDGRRENIYETQTIRDLCQSATKRLENNYDLFSRLICAHPQNIYIQEKQLFLRKRKTYNFQQQNSVQAARDFLIEAASEFYPMTLAQLCLFPSKMDLQHDCGKMVLLSQLLRKFKTEGHKCILFTQMSKVLDLLEIFLNLHGYTYVRLDGSTSILQRQRVVDLFNNDPRVFIFMASTRAGGMGLNLTGGDTVIFYDTDWNPAMDRQAMDRCHRIGQTRDVHVYRLITEFTIEENILRKQLVKRALDEVVVDQGHFTTEHFSTTKEHTSFKDMLVPPTDANELYVTRVLHESKLPDQSTPQQPTFFEKAITEVESLEPELQESLDTSVQNDKPELNVNFQQVIAKPQGELPIARDGEYPSTEILLDTFVTRRPSPGTCPSHPSDLTLVQLNAETNVYVTELVRAAVTFLETYPSLSIINDTMSLRRKLKPDKC